MRTSLSTDARKCPAIRDVRTIAAQYSFGVVYRPLTGSSYCVRARPSKTLMICSGVGFFTSGTSSSGMDAWSSERRETAVLLKAAMLQPCLCKRAVHSATYGHLRSAVQEIAGARCESPWQRRRGAESESGGREDSDDDSGRRLRRRTPHFKLL